MQRSDCGTLPQQGVKIGGGPGGTGGGGDGRQTGGRRTMVVFLLNRLPISDVRWLFDGEKKGPFSTDLVIENWN